MTEAAATSDAKKLREDIALVRQYADTIICLLPNMMGVLDRCLAAAEAHERCEGEAIPDALAVRVESALNTAIGVASVHAREVQGGLLLTAMAFTEWLNESARKGDKS
jgi:hypothetical protein